MIYNYTKDGQVPPVQFKQFRIHILIAITAVIVVVVSFI